MQALKWADERRRSLDPEGTIVPDDLAEFLDRRGWYFTAYYLTREYVEANKNPLEIKEIFKTLSSGTRQWEPSPSKPSKTPGSVRHWIVGYPHALSRARKA